MTRRILGMAAAALAFAAMTANAQQPQTSRVHGVIAHVDGGTLVLQLDGGAEATVKVADNPQVFWSEPATIADVKVGDYVGVGAMSQLDGSQKAVEVTIFAESQRGTAEGFGPWNRPGSTMTNATVNSTVAGVDGQVVIVKYKDGEKKIIIGPDTQIRRYVPADKSALAPGAHIAMPRAEKLADGTLQAGRFYVGRNGVVPQ